MSDVDRGGAQMRSYLEALFPSVEPDLPEGRRSPDNQRAFQDNIEARLDHWLDLPLAERQRICNS